MALSAELDAEFHVRYPGAPVFGIDAASLIAHGGVFLIAYDKGGPLGCGALRPLEGDIVEIKRMFVRPEARGRGIPCFGEYAASAHSVCYEKGLCG
ncbi:MAG: GNAT family N-acetyltransferase [Vicinamibacterales bacterium]